MPKNSTGTIAIYTDVAAYTATSTAGGQHTFSPEDTEVRFRNIPANINGVGLLLFLPGGPSDGDEYTFSDRDGSFSPGHVIVVILFPKRLCVALDAIQAAFPKSGAIVAT
jgi:hypothetical protein